MYFRFLSVAFFVLVSSLNFVFAQCPQGAIGVSGVNCGCLAGCNLTSFGGPNCGGAGVAGNCSAGQVAMSVDIIVPDGCTFTVTAVMQTRPGCSASGADAGEQLKVDIPGGPKPFQTGTSNATITDNYTLAGPATIRVSGTANRADEIITYSTTYSGAFCNACGSILPVELLTFSGLQEERTIGLNWTTASEINSDHFLLERSIDGKTFELIANVNAAGNSSSALNYKIYDSQPPLAKVIYYRLRQIDKDGVEAEPKLIAVNYDSDLIHYGYQLITINLAGVSQELNVVEFYDLHGLLIERYVMDGRFMQIPWNRAGIWLVRFPEIEYCEKVITY